MQTAETIPLFKTRSMGAGAVAATNTDPAALPPMRNHTGKPALPAELWVDFAMLGEALSAQRQLSAQHATVCGLDSATGRYYVRGYGWQW